jgi:hypothetical protein
MRAAMNTAMPTERQAKIMQAIFDLCEAIDGDTSIADIMDVMRFAVEDGLEMMALNLAMASLAADRVAAERKQPA